MKRLPIILSAVLILLVCATTVKAQTENKSAENSPVFIAHYWVDTPQLIGCDEAIYFNVRLHVVIKRFKGVQTVFFNSHGEGVDSEGGVWTWIDTWKRTFLPSYEIIYENDNHLIQGPKGAKGKLKVLFVINGNGEIVQNKVESSCK